LDPCKVFEIIIYTHDVVYNNVSQLLDEIEMNNFINYRIIPIHYNYHGYVKQMVIKANSYKDVTTDYVVILDSDLILYQKLNFYNLLVDNKIIWYYIDKKDDADNVAFSVWKTAVENSIKHSFDTEYMLSCPFIFNRKSLEDAANKFIEIHQADYETYCYNKCNNLNIDIETPITSIFDILSTIFTEFEYLGFYCHHYSNDYIFFSYYKSIKNNTLNNYSTNYFKKYWSHGGINNEISNEINCILNN
jgi:hypothetical protein